MKKILILLFAVAFNFAFSQTAGQIISKNIEVTGGLKNWKLLNSITLQGKVILGVNDEYPVKIYQQRPNLNKTVVVVGKKENVVEGFDGKKGYKMDYVKNKLVVDNAYISESFDSDFIDFENKGFTAEFIGKETLNGIPVFKVELNKNQNRTVYFFDAKTYMLLKEIKKDETLDYSDYRRAGNLLMPYKIVSSSPKKDGDYIILLNSVAVNRAFPADTFKL